MSQWFKPSQHLPPKNTPVLCYWVKAMPEHIPFRHHVLTWNGDGWYADEYQSLHVRQAPDYWQRLSTPESTGEVARD